MERESRYEIVVLDESQFEANAATGSLVALLAETEGVIRVDRGKTNNSAMDLGTVMTVVMSSGATIAVGRGISAWLRGRRGAGLTIERTEGSASIKVIVSGIDPDTSTRIVENVVAVPIDRDNSAT